MSAENQGAVVDSGPVEIVLVGQTEEKTEPTETVAKTEPIETVAKAGSEENVGENHDDKGNSKPGVQTRIDELTRARREAERDAAYWKIRAESNDRQTDAKANEKQPPVRTNFADEAAYVDALVDFKADQKLDAKLAERDTQQQRVKAQESHAQSWNEKLAAARVDIPDFDTVMNAGDAPVANHVAELIMEHDHGAKVAHHLAQNPQEVARLNDLSVAKAAFEIGKIASKFDTPPASSSEPVVKSVSKAPPPVARTVGSGRATSTPLGEMPMDDYVKARKSQGAGWAR